jgi:hypothetical protein
MDKKEERNGGTAMRILISTLIMSVFAGCSVYGQTEPPPVYDQTQPPPGYGQTQPPPTYGQTEPPPVPGQEQPEVLTSGPVHEAYAEPVNLQDQPGLEVPQEPPAMIQETPPAERPQGDQYVWVPGYWAWDSDRNGYIWVSACWRAAPPNTYWVPGYWARTSGGWVWVAGFWAPTGTQRIQYLPAPPAYDDVEPPGPAPSPDVVWVPPCPYWYQDQYIRRAGYWVQMRQGWLWTPSHYIWTPRGYVFVDGHWDYSLNRRGVLFAPVYFPQSVYLRPGFTYSPSIVIDIGALQVNLFTYPRYCHYYFGDYYDDSYISLGIYPWFDWERHHTWYDPIYSYDRWRYRRTDPQWDEHERQEYDRRRADRDLRPTRTYREMETRMTRVPEAQRRNVELARPLTAVAAAKSGPVTFQRIDRNTQKQIATRAANTQQFREQRNRWESTRTTQGAAPTPAERRGQTTPIPQAERRPTPTPTPERGQPIPTPQAERRPTPAPTPERGQRAIPPAAERTPAPTTPRQVPLTRPETVNIPRPPITANTGRQQAAPPPRPSEERQGARGGGTQETDRNRNRGR